MRAGSKVVVLVFGVFVWPSSGGTAVPGLRPKMPALVMGEVDQCVVVQQHATQWSRGNRTKLQLEDVENLFRVREEEKQGASGEI
jgi:hypothetical protein